jgi:glycosyltransferase involved in cell wall biosynthesis
VLTRPVFDKFPDPIVSSIPPKISVFIPCLDEEDNVAGALDKVFTAADEVGITCEAVVFDDGSTDRTSEVVEKYRRDHPQRAIVLVRHEKPIGVASNFIDGAFIATGEYYRMVCGDNIEPLETHKAIFSAIGTADIVVPAYRQILNRRPHRVVISKLFTFLVNRISGNRIGYYNGGPVFRRRDVMRYHVETSGFGFQAEFLTRLLALGRTCRQLPLVADDREGSTALSFRNLVSVGHSFLNIGLRRLRVVIFKP